MRENEPLNRTIVVEGDMWLGSNEYQGASEVAASIWVDAPYGHEVGIRIARPPEQGFHSFVGKVRERIEGARVHVSATVVNGCLTTTLDDISRVVLTDDGAVAFDEMSRRRIDMLDDLFGSLCDVPTHADHLPVRPGSRAMIVAILSPLIERVHPVSCEASPTGGVIASFRHGGDSISVHALPQGHVTISGGSSWNASARHDVPSAQTELRRILDR